MMAWIGQWVVVALTWLAVFVNMEYVYFGQMLPFPLVL